MGEGREEGLQVLHDERHQRLEWRLEILAWGAIGALLLAAIAGLLGPGPLSDTVATAAGLRLEYQRFIHYQGPYRLRFHLLAGDDGIARVWLDRAFVEDIDIQRVDPVPAWNEAEAARYVWVFHAPKPGEALVATIRYKPDFIGYRAGSAGLDGGDELRFWQFAYP